MITHLIRIDKLINLYNEKKTIYNLRIWFFCFIFAVSN